MRRTIRNILLASTLSLLPCMVLGATTAQLYLYEINVDAAGSTFVNQVYSTALAAQLAGKPVIFAGTCDSDGVHFRITHILSRS